MKTGMKARLLNIFSIAMGTAALLFSFGASWIIMQESVGILKSMLIDTNMFIGASLFAGILLLWLNSLMIDSVTWTVARYWRSTKGEGSE